MNEWKNRLRQGLALLLAIMLIGMGMNFTAMTVSAEEADDEIVMVDAGYLDEYIIQKGGSPSSYQSEERCKMDGYERLFVDPLRGPVYAKESFILNPHDGSAESIGYSFAIVEGYI